MQENKLMVPSEKVPAYTKLDLKLREGLLILVVEPVVRGNMIEIVCLMVVLYWMYWMVTD